MSTPADRRAAALAATEARLRGEPSAVDLENTPKKPKEEVFIPPTEKEIAESMRVLRRLLDRGLVRDNGYRQSAEAVEQKYELLEERYSGAEDALVKGLRRLIDTKILLKIANNILNSSDPKFKTLKASNAMLKNKVLSAKGGHDYMIAMGFRIQTVDHVQNYVLVPTLKRMHELRLGADVLASCLPNLQARAAGLVNSNTSAKSEEARRVAQTLREIEEDRDLVKRRVERERFAREAREKVQAQKEAEEKAKAEAEGGEGTVSRGQMYTGGMDGDGTSGGVVSDMRWKGGRTLDGRTEEHQEMGDDDIDEEEWDGQQEEDDDEDSGEDGSSDVEDGLRQRRPHGASAYRGEGRRLGGPDDVELGTD